jgi:LemA protein
MEARAKAVSATGVAAKGAAEGELTQALGRLFAVFENYPDLKSNQNVLRLQEELTTTENQIGFARQHYNDLVMRYNTRQEVFPTNLVAGMLGFQRAEFLEIAETDRAVPAVDLSLS